MATDVTRAQRITPIPSLTGSGAESGSSAWWLDRLHARMWQRNLWLDTLRAYYRGTQDTWRLASDTHRSAFGRLFEGLKANLAKPVVDAVEQRLEVQGFTMEGDREGERLAWSWWRDSGMRARSSVAHIEALSVGECPLIVWRDPGARMPRITVEDPLSVIVERDIVDPRRLRAGMKAWRDPDTGELWSVLYLPDRVEWWRHADGGWRLMVSGGNPIGVVPIVTLLNIPRLTAVRHSLGEAEHECVLPLIDLYNKTLLDLATTSEFAAFPQRWAVGVALEDESLPSDADADGVDDDRVQTDTEGDPIQTEAAGLRAGVNRLWKFEDSETKLGQFAVSDLTPYINALQTIRSDISSATHTPHRKLIPPPTSVPPSGESVRMGDEGLTAKVGDRHVWYGEGYEEALRLGFLWMGDPARAAREDLETNWVDPEVRTEAEHMDALTKLSSLGVPQEALWEMIPATPTQIEKWRTMRPVTQEEPRTDGNDTEAG